MVRVKIRGEAVVPSFSYNHMLQSHQCHLFHRIHTNDSTDQVAVSPEYGHLAISVAHPALSCNSLQPWWIKHSSETHETKCIFFKLLHRAASQDSRHTQ